MFSNGARVKFTPSALERDPDADRDRGRRGVIRDQSTASRRRAAFAFGNADAKQLRPVRWCATTTLTWHAIPPREMVKVAWTEFRRAWRKRWGECVDAWVMEIQERGAPHFHLFHCRESIAGGMLAALIDEGRTKTFERADGSSRTILRGNAVRWIEETWLECSGQTDDAAARAFTAGGLVEPLRSPDAAGRYIAKECAKREQKELPEIYSQGLGRWWFLSPRWKPQSWGHGEIDLDRWPWDVPISHVWKAGDVAGCLDRFELLGEAAQNADAAAIAAETFAPLDPAIPREPMPFALRDRMPKLCECGRNAPWDVQILTWRCRPCERIWLP